MDFAQGPALAGLLPGSILLDYVGDANNNANSATISFAGFDGETAGGIHIHGWIQSASFSPAVYWILAPNDISINQTTTGSITTSLGMAILANANATATAFEFDIVCSSTKTGSGSRVFSITTISGGVTTTMTGTWADSTTPINRFVLKAVQQSNGAGPGVVTLQQTIASNGVLTQMTWNALGN
jgi:hypothetical protein